MTGDRLRRFILWLGMPILLGFSLVAATVVPASASEVASAEGSAFGLEATGLIPLTATPTIASPPTGSTQEVTISVAGLVSATVLPLTTGSVGVPGFDGSVTSTSSLAGVSIVPGVVTVGALSSTCTANGDGTQASSSVTTLKIAGVAVSLPSPVPANYGINIPLVGSLELNEQTSSSSGGKNIITVDALSLTLLLNTQTLTIGQSYCEADTTQGVGTFF
jgi:hypothetical protein